MARILRCAIVLLIADGTMVNFRVFARAMSTVAKSFETQQVVPDVVPKAPSALVAVSIKPYYLFNPTLIARYQSNFN